MELSDLRDDYGRGRLLESAVDPNPFVQFRLWLDDAMQLNLREPYAMTLATATPDGMPSARTVLLRGFDERGFAFFTNYESRKGKDLRANPRASLLFYWGDLERQVRADGPVERTSAEESDRYFATRPRESRLGAWASPQSNVLNSWEQLDELHREAALRFPDDVPRPPFWGGFRLTPDSFEFWQGGLHRLHDRLHYVRSTDGSWRIQRLAP